MTRLGALPMLLVAAVSAGPATAGELRVLAAVSTGEAMEEIGQLYRDRGGNITFSFASTPDLAHQIENGAPADIFISAGEEWFDYLIERGGLVASSRTVVAGNDLVLVAPLDSSIDLRLAPGADLAGAIGDGYLAVADPDTVPAGRYAKAALGSLGLWSAVEPAIVRARDVRAALALAERGEVAAAVVYATDLRLARVRVVDRFPAGSHVPIAYVAGIVSDRDGADARAFLAFLSSEPARTVWRAHGFVIEGSPGVSN